MKYLTHLLLRHLRQYPGRTLTALGVLTAAATLMLALAGAGVALRFRVTGHLARMFPEEQLWLEAGRASLGPIALEPNPITDETVKAVRARPEAAQVWPVEPLRVPVVAAGNLFGQELAADAVIHGVDRALVSDALRKDQPWGKPASPEEPYPVVVSRFFLDLYNLGMARASGLPLLSENLLLGKHATLYLGTSTALPLPPAKTPRSIQAMVAGVTTHPGLLALEMPAEVVRALNREYQPGSPPQYVKLAVQLNKGADRDEFLKAVAPLGLVVPGSDVAAGQVKRAVRLAGWGLILLAAAVFALGMLTFYTLFTMIFHARRQDLVRLRALGLSPAEAVALALGEVGLPATCAVATATAAVGALQTWAVARLAGVAELAGVLPPELFRTSWGWHLAAGGAILLVTLLPALPALRWIARVEPAAVIRDL
jgi:hypothetical protein